jgi:predicted Fe-Mo cluster-binding NifX family protein
MKIAISILEANEHAPIDAHFGRCRHFCVVDTADGSRRVVDNSAGANSAQGAGFKAVETIAALGVTTVITGQLGPKAAGALKAAGIQAFSAESGTVDEVLALLEKQQLNRIG